MDQTVTIREEEIKNSLRDQFFSAYDATPILGDIDFAVTSRRDDPSQQELFEREWFLWAEAKKGSSHSINDSFIQLILTIGKAHIHEKHMPPTFLGAFDAEKIAFVEFHHIVSVLYQNDFNWNVTPSNHNTKEFKQLKAMVEDTLREHIAKFNLKKDEKELRQFIKKNFRDGRKTDGVAITRNNYLFVFQRWVEEVKPTIGVDWNDIPATRVADFFFADLISRGDYTLRSDLAVVLRGDEYKILEQIMQSGKMLFSECAFNDGMKAYRAFWNKYKRPPRQEAIDIILERRDLLIPHNLRQYQGAFFTPPQWVELSQRYIADELGEDWQQQYYVWDCCAGTGNLLFGLTEPYRVWASTLDHGDVQVMKKRAEDGELNLLEKHIFQFDFLNDDFKDLPESLRTVINDPEKRKRLIVYINPPYAEAGNRRVIVNSDGEEKQKTNVAVSHHTYRKYLNVIGIAGRELFAQFFIRIYCEIPGAILAEFSKLKIMQAPNFREFRKAFKARLKRSFLVSANSFDNVTGKFPIGFFIWDLSEPEIFTHTVSDVYNNDGIQTQQKKLWALDETKSINDWLIETRNQYNEKKIGYMSCRSHDMSNVNYNFIMNDKCQMKSPRGSWVTDKNIREVSVYLAVCHCVEPNWLNDRDQFLYPDDNWQHDLEFQTDCLIFSVFSNSNNIRGSLGVNYWIPFTEQEVGAQDNFASHFMSDYLHEKHIVIQNTEAADLFSKPSEQGKTVEICPLDYLSSEAKAVMDSGRELWRYYHSQENANPNASYYDIRLYFQGTKITKSGKEQMNSDSTDETYTNLHNALKQAMRKLAAHIEPKVYQYGFLK
ncbi:MAG: hypothetical protein J5711_08115 [Bacteroidales bacterium]|nr:hypothetical protein [Bacteroidales bacterium]